MTEVVAVGQIGSRRRPHAGEVENLSRVIGEGDHVGLRQARQSSLQMFLNFLGTDGPGVAVGVVHPAATGLVDDLVQHQLDRLGGMIDLFRQDGGDDVAFVDGFGNGVFAQPPDRDGDRDERDQDQDGSGGDDASVGRTPHLRPSPPGLVACFDGILRAIGFAMPMK